MGVKGLAQVIDSNLSTICTNITSIQGQLVIDGVNLLHEFYVHHHLDWANGGGYPRLREVTLEFFENLKSAKVQPIVIMDGAGIERHLQDTIYRRNRSIGDIPECIQKAHTPQQAQGGIHSDTRHFLPALSLATFAHAVKKIGGVTLIHADGKANTTVVRLANHYGCPVLGNDTNYCVFDIRGGVIFYKYLTLGPGLCTAYIVNRNWLFRGHFKLSDLSLVFAMVAMLGDGGDMSVPSLYHSRSPLKSMIDRRPGVDGGRNSPLNVAQFLKGFRNLEHFKQEVNTFNLSSKVKSQLSENCLKAKEKYTISFTISLQGVLDFTEIKCSYPCSVPSPLLRQFRNGDLPNFLIDAIALGKTCLSQQVGDVVQSPVVMLGCPVREATYGFASGLMNQSSSESITEFHRNISNAQHQLSYSAQVVKPVCTQRDLMVTNIAQLDKMTRISLAKQTIYTILKCTRDSVSAFDNDAERSWLLVIAVTQFWARHQLKNRLLPNADRVIRSMVYSFVRCSNRVPNEDDREPQPSSMTYEDPNWIKAYHAALEWQCLYADTIGLNAILMQPFEVPSPAGLYDGELVMYYCTMDGSVDAKVQQLPAKMKALYDKLLAAISSI